MPAAVRTMSPSSTTDHLHHRRDDGRYCLLSMYESDLRRVGDAGRRQRLRALVRDLGLLDDDSERRRQHSPPDRGASSSSSSSHLPIAHRWSVQTNHVCSMHQLPHKHAHAGAFAWDAAIAGVAAATATTNSPAATSGELKPNDPTATQRPAYLWDSQLGKTVEATSERLLDGYIAVSYTWGQYAAAAAGSGRKREAGTDWPLPEMKPTVCPNLLGRLKKIMVQMPAARYFWVDVLCVNMDDATMQRAERAKEAAIYGNAKAVMVYLWTLDFLDDLSQAMASLGDTLLWSLQAPRADADDEEAAAEADRPISELTLGPDVRTGPRIHRDGKTKLPTHLMDPVVAKLRLDVWFSSLWALQEMIVAPNAFWVTRDGGCCTVNGMPVTSRFIASATQLLEFTDEFRFHVWRHLSSFFPASGEQERLAAVVGARCDEVLASKRVTHEWQRSGPIVEQAYMARRCSGIEVKDSLQVSIDVAGRPNTLPPALMAAHQRERALRKQSHAWTNWAHGSAGLHLCLLASRTGVLTAATGRITSGSRSAAVLAALKVKGQPQYEKTDSAGPGGLHTELLNNILRLEGARFLFVSHRLIQSTEVRSAQSPLYIEGSHKGTGAQSPHCFFSSALPSTATFCNPRELEWSRYSFTSSRNWRVLPDGSLHLPPGTILQRASAKGRVKLARNMSPETNDYIPARLVKVALKAGDHMTEQLGADCRIKFLPLCVRKDSGGGSPTVSVGVSGDEGSGRGGEPPRGRRRRLAAGSGPTDDDGGPLWMRRPGDPGPKAVGLVLVGRRSLSKGSPRTTWHKWGMYWSTEYEETRLENWEDGVCVAAMKGEGEGDSEEDADATWSGWLTRTVQGWIAPGAAVSIDASGRRMA